MQPDRAERLIRAEPGQDVVGRAAEHHQLGMVALGVRLLDRAVAEPLGEIGRGGAAVAQQVRGGDFVVAGPLPGPLRGLDPVASVWCWLRSAS